MLYQFHCRVKETFGCLRNFRKCSADCKALPNKRIFFIPDKNLARYVAEQVPEKELYLITDIAQCMSICS